MAVATKVRVWAAALVSADRRVDPRAVAAVVAVDRQFACARLSTGVPWLVDVVDGVGASQTRS